MDSTTGVQMAYVKQWAPRSANPLTLRVPELLPGRGRAVLGDALAVAPARWARSTWPISIPPYNQHRYFTNYHVWETLVAWDAPEPYGVARKRLDARDPGHPERVQLQADHARRAAPGGAQRATASCWCCPTTTRRGWASRSSRRCAARVGRWRHWPSTPPATWVPASAFSTRRGQGGEGVASLQPGAAGHRRRGGHGAPRRRRRRPVRRRRRGAERGAGRVVSWARELEPARSSARWGPGVSQRDHRRTRSADRLQ